MPSSRRHRVTAGLLSRAVVAAWVAVFLVTPSWAARTEFTVKDAQVLGRTMGFVGNGMTGVAVIGVAFSVDSLASRREADAMRAIVGDGLPTGRVVLRLRLVPVEQLPTVSGIDALFVTAGLSANAAVLAAARRLHIPTMSTDMSCVEAATCILGFSSSPTVQIVIDRGAADQAGVRFVEAFRMLVREK